MFSKAEKRLIDKQYFEIIRETENFIEVKSKNTEHCWIIQKHLSECERKVFLYHKHSINDSYYHQHYKAYTVKQVVCSIKGHDEYVLKNLNFI